MDKFKYFNGFHLNGGDFGGHFNLEPRQVALNILDSQRGTKVTIAYESFGHRNSLYHRVNVPKKGPLEGLVHGSPDNIEIELGQDRGRYEIQRIVIGNQSVSQLAIYGGSFRGNTK